MFVPLQIFSISTSFSTSLFAVFFLMLSREKSQAYMRYWGFMLLAAGLTCITDFFIGEYASFNSHLMLVRVFLLILCSNLFFAGTCNFFKIRQPKAASIAFAVATALTALSALWESAYEIVVLPLILYSSLILAGTGLLFTLYAWTARVPEKYLISFVIIFWSIYNSNLPFRSGYLAIRLVNYTFSLCLLNSLVILLLIIHYKKDEFRIQSQEKHYRLLVENAAGVILLYIYGERRFRYVSLSAERELGLSAETLYNNPLSILDGIEQEDRAQIETLLDFPPSGPVDFTFSRVLANNETRWFELFASPVRDHAAFPIGVECVISNITARLELMEQFKQAERYRKELVEDISHELKTPLTIIQGYTEALMHDTSDDMNASYLEIIHTKTEALNKLFEELIQTSLFSSQRTEYKFYEVEATNYLNRMLNESHIRLEREGRVVTCQNFVPENTIFVIDKERIDQICTNILTNALRHTNPGDRISIICRVDLRSPATTDDVREKNAALSTKGAAASAKGAVPSAKGSSPSPRGTMPSAKGSVSSLTEAESLGAIPQEMVTVQISDSGCGISNEDLPHIFKRRYTGKNRSEEAGRGLGLYISHEIIKQHNGTLRAENNPDGGASFSFSIPCYHAQANEPKTEAYS